MPTVTVSRTDVTADEVVTALKDTLGQPRRPVVRLTQPVGVGDGRRFPE